MIRQATVGDIPQLLAWGAKFHAQGASGPAYDRRAVSDLLARMTSGGGVVLMHDDGMIGGVLAPAYCDPAWIMAVELFWWADRDGMALLRAFEDWARENGAAEVRMTTLAKLPRADALLRRKGYAPIEISYTRGL